MSPRASSSSAARSASAPYPRRPAGQPKSSRQQFSACGACRMRRVRCDLKDLDITGPHPACSNCRERGLKCVDEFADVKAVKLLRRGRRLQQVEAIYGKSGEAAPEAAPVSSPTSSRRVSAIPQLQPEFFNSHFWKRFCIQRPILDSNDFSARFMASLDGHHDFGIQGRMITMLLVIWALSFNVDEYGFQIGSASDDPHSPTNLRMSPSTSSTVKSKRNDGDSRKGLHIADRIQEMISEVLELIDRHAIMRQPTWDGVAVLLLLLPLIDEMQSPIDRVTIYNNAMSQIHILASTSLLAAPSTRHSASEALQQARIFCYAYVDEGVSTALQGGRLIFDEDDLSMFEKNIPSLRSASGSSASGLPSPHTPSVRLPMPIAQQIPLSQLQGAHDMISHPSTPQFQSSPVSFFHPTSMFEIPLHLSTICRKIHCLLTSQKAKRMAEEGRPVDYEGLREIWQQLARCWDELESIKRRTSGSDSWDTERFASTWQIFIFECFNMVREALKQQVVSNLPPGGRISPIHPTSMHATSAPSPTSSSSSLTSAGTITTRQLCASATRKCMRLLPRVLDIIQMHLSNGGDDDAASIFSCDSGIVRGGCFFAGYLAAGGASDAVSEGSGLSEHTTESVVGVELCLRALSEMRWAFSKADDRQHTIRMVWNANKMLHRQAKQHIGHLSVDTSVIAHHPSTQPQTQFPYIGHHPAPLPTILESSNGSTVDRNGTTWTVYTPPGTATSSTGNSSGSPVYTTMTGPPTQGFKVEDPFYPSGTDMDGFSFSAPGLTNAHQEIVGDFRHRSHHHTLHASGTANYIDNAVDFMNGGPSSDMTQPYEDHHAFFQ